MFMVFATCLVLFFIAVLLQIFWRNFYSNASCFSLLWLYLGNSQVSVYRTIGPTLVLFLDYLVTKVTMVIDTYRFCFRIKLSYICI